MQTNTTPPTVYIPAICEYDSQAILPIMQSLAGLTYTDADTLQQRYYFSTIYGISEKDAAPENAGRPICMICKEYKAIVPDDKEYSFAFFYTHGQNITYNGQYYEYDISLLGWINERAFSSTSRGAIAKRLVDQIYINAFERNFLINSPTAPSVDTNKGINISTYINDEVWTDFDAKTFLESYEKYVSYRIRFKVGLPVNCKPYVQSLANNSCFTC